MRKDPPVDAEFINAVHLLGFAEREGVLVVNPTAALLQCNEKLFAQQFPSAARRRLWRAVMMYCAPFMPSTAM